MAPKIVDPKNLKTAISSVLGLSQAYFAAQCVNAIVRLGVPDALGDEVLTAPEINGRVGGKANEDALKRCMKLLSLKGFFVESNKNNESAFALTDEGALLQTNAPQPSMACSVLHWTEKPMWSAWAEVPDFVAGQTTKAGFEAANGLHLFDYYAQQPESAKPFNEFMSFFSVGEQPVILSAVPWSSFEGKTVVDVGGSLGTVMALVKANFPGLQCVSLDLPEVVATVQVPPAGVKMVAGSFFDGSTIPPCDAIFLKHILHDWNDEKCIKILMSCRQALQPGGKVFVAEVVLPGPGEHTERKLAQVHLDTLMMIIDGKERDEGNFRSLATASGFKFDRIIATPHPTCQIVVLEA
mmetsp:Transcript_27287/g.76767  ORF Transcript_27287/g.76767 Transcript_27287/m.76767 type:complete len:353 (+) Transcript_27287:88-1146(+)